MKIAVINTGGTISCTGSPLAPMSAEAFAGACKDTVDKVIRQNYPTLVIDYVTDLTFPESASGTLDSTNLQPTDWCLVASYILQHYARYDGWVVLHGTDSMDFTGTALPFLLTSFDAKGIQTAALSKPIIITGSQMPMFYQANEGGTTSWELIYNTDAFQNFCGAVAAAQTGIPEVCVYFQNKLYRGNRVLKTNASEFNAFSSPNYPALAEYGVELSIAFENVLPPPVGYAVSLDNPDVLKAAVARMAYVSANIDKFPVMQFNAFPAKYNFKDGTALIAKLIDACVAQGILGLILESYGEGNFPSGNPDTPSAGATYKSLKKANENGVVIVDCTQVIAGVVNDSAYAAGAWLPSVGALNPADMTPMAAFAKLMVLLTDAGYCGWSQDDVKRLLQLDLLGEMRDVSRLDSRGNAELLAGQSISALDGSASLVNDPMRGPVLSDSKGNTLWTALASPSGDQMPGRLIMQNDGNLVFYSRYNAPLWATNTGVPSGASSLLVLDGSAAAASGTPGALALYVYNYSGNTLSKVLYPQPQQESSMQTRTRGFKFSGRIAPENALHQTIVIMGPNEAAPEEQYLPPNIVKVKITHPTVETIGIPQYSPTVRDTSSVYNPAGDCQGNFMSYKFQPNNNCYAYGCNITTNTFPQPGRASGYLITTLDGPTVKSYAEMDGLQYVGSTMADIMTFKQKKQATTPPHLLGTGALGGHFVALMISPPGDGNS